MQLDSAGRFSIVQYFPGISKGKKVANFYLCWYKRRRRGEEKPRILIEVSDSLSEPDSEMMFLGKVNVDPKSRVAITKILTNVYGISAKERQNVNLIVYTQRGKVYIERE